MFLSPSDLSPISPFLPNYGSYGRSEKSVLSKPEIPLCEVTPPASSTNSEMDERMSEEVILERAQSRSPTLVFESSPPFKKTISPISSMDNPFVVSPAKEFDDSDSGDDQKEDDDDETSNYSSVSCSSYTLNIPKSPKQQLESPPVGRPSPGALSRLQSILHSHLGSQYYPPPQPTFSSRPPLPLPPRSPSRNCSQITTAIASPVQASIPPRPLRPNLPVLTVRIPSSSLSPVNREFVEKERALGYDRGREALKLMVNASPYPRAMGEWGRI